MRRILATLAVFGSMSALGLPSGSGQLAEENQNPTFSTIDPPGAIYSEAVDINPRGDIVGRYYDGSVCTLPCVADDGQNHGFLLSQGQFTTIDFPGAVFTGALGINRHGDIVGRYDLAVGETHGYLLSAGEFTTIDFPEAAATSALAINPRGDIVGQYTDALGHIHGYLLSDGEFATIDFPGSIRTNLWKINPAGDIVGRYLSPDGRSHAFLLSGGDFSSIDFPGAFDTAPQAAAGINARGEIVSSYCDAAPCTFGSNGNVHAFLLRRGEFTSFDFPDSFLTVASGISSRGDIVGVYKDRLTTDNCAISPSCSQGHAFLLTSRERERHEQ